MRAVEGHVEWGVVDGQAGTPAHRRHGWDLPGRLHHARARTGSTWAAQQVPQEEPVSHIFTRASGHGPCIGILMGWWVKGTIGYFRLIFKSSTRRAFLAGGERRIVTYSENSASSVQKGPNWSICRIDRHAHFHHLTNTVERLYSAAMWVSVIMIPNYFRHCCWIVSQMNIIKNVKLEMYLYFK